MASSKSRMEKSSSAAFEARRNSCCSSGRVNVRVAVMVLEFTLLGEVP